MQGGGREIPSINITTEFPSDSPTHSHQVLSSGLLSPYSPTYSPPLSVLDLLDPDSPPSPTLSNHSGRFPSTLQLRDNKPEEKSGLSSLGLLNPDSFRHYGQHSPPYSPPWPEEKSGLSSLGLLNPDSLRRYGQDSPTYSPPLTVILDALNDVPASLYPPSPTLSNHSDGFEKLGLLNPDSFRRRGQGSATTLTDVARSDDHSNTTSVDHADNTTEFSEAVHGNADAISHEPFAPIAPRITQSVLNSSPKPKWSARMGSVMRRISTILTNPRPATAASERDTDNASLSSPSLPIIVTPPSPIAESPLREAAAQAQESVGPSPLSTSSKIVLPTLSPSVEESLTGYIIPPVIDSTAGNPGAFTDEPEELPQPDIAQNPQAFGPVEPHVEPTTLNPPESAEPETIVNEALVDEPTPYSVEPMEESIKDFEPIDRADKTAEFSEAVHGNTNVISHEPFADPIAPRITQPVLDMPQYVDFPLHHLRLLIDSYRQEFADDYRQGPTETHSHSPVVMPLPSFDDVIASIPMHRTPSMSSLKNGNTGNLVETESVFLKNFFCFVSLTSFLFAAKSSLFFLAQPSHLSIFQRHIFKHVRVTLCPFLLPSILLPNR